MSFCDSRLEVEALLTWFPTRSNAVLKEVRMRSVTIRHTTSEGVFQAGNRAGLMIGQGLAPGEDSLAPGGAVRAFVEVGLDDHMRAYQEFRVRAGRTSSQATIAFEKRSANMTAI